MQVNICQVPYNKYHIRALKAYDLTDNTDKDKAKPPSRWNQVLRNQQIRLELQRSPFLSSICREAMIRRKLIWGDA